MTVSEFYNKLAAWGFTKRKASYAGATLYEDRDKEIYSIPDPEGLSAEERVDFLELLRLRAGLED